ncbi:hypothetical protein ACU3L3_07785 [Priestia endophytica]
MKTNSLKLESKVVYFLLAIFPIMSLYGFLPLLSIGYLIILLLIIVNWVTRKFIITINLKLLITMSILMIINTVVGISKYADVTNTLNNTAGMLVFSFIAIHICASSKINLMRLYNACKIVALAATFFLFIQFIFYYYSGTVIMGNIPFLTPIESGFKSITYGRATSFFYEPAHYSIYIAPVYAMSIIRKEFVTSFLLAAGLVLSTSSTGIIMAIIIPVIILTKSKRFLINSIVAILVGGIILLGIDKYYSEFYEKVSFDALASNIRIFGTLDYFKHYSSSDWLFGIGLNRLKEFLLNHGYGYSLSENYASAYIFSFLSFGIIGGLIWLVYTVSLYRNILKRYKVIFWILIIVSFTDQILFNRNLLYLLLWIYAVSSSKITDKRYIN